MRAVKRHLIPDGVLRNNPLVFQCLEHPFQINGAGERGESRFVEIILLLALGEFAHEPLRENDIHR